MVVTPDNAAGNPGLNPVGAYAAYFVSDFTNPQSISHNVPLVADTSYTFEFDVYKPNNAIANPNDAAVTVSLAGTGITSFSADTLAPTTWQTFLGARSFVAAISGTFSFNFTSNGFPAKDFVIDRVFLAETSAVPEPAG